MTVFQNRKRTQQPQKNPFSLFCFAILFFGFTATGHADKKKEAKGKFREAIEFARQENYLEALHAFEESYQLWPSPSTLLNIGMANKALYRYVEAITAFERFLAEAGAKTKRQKREEAERALAELRQLIGTLKLEQAPTGAKVYINAALKATLPTDSPLMLNPGQHTLEVNLEGYESFKSTIQIISGAETTIVAKLAPAMARLKIDCGGKSGIVNIDGEAQGGCPYDGKVTPGRHQLLIEAPGMQPVQKEVEAVSGSTLDIQVDLLPDVTATDSDGKSSPSGDNPVLKIAGWTSLGLGVAGAAVGSIFVYRYIDERDKVDAIYDDIEAAKEAGDTALEASLTQMWTTASADFKDAESGYKAGIAVGYSVGAALVITGTVLLLVNKKRAKSTRAQVAIQPTPNGIAVTF